MSSNKEALKKIDAIWSGLGFLSDGPAEWRGGKRSEQCTRESVQRRLKARPPVGLNDRTLQAWAKGICSHLQDPDSEPARGWILRVLEGHEKKRLDDLPLLYPDREMPIGEILQRLINFDRDKEGGEDPYNKAQKITYSQRAWHQVLRDDFPFDEFELLFGLTEKLPNRLNQRRGDNNSMSNTNNGLSNAVTARWNTDYCCDRATCAALNGKYFLYRADDIVFNRARVQENPGWFGDQKVQVVPVEITTEADQFLKWEDCYPIPGRKESMNESIGYIAQQGDDAFEVRGVDTVFHKTVKFLGMMEHVGRQLDGRKRTARGVMFIRNGGLARRTEAYRFWLQEVEEKEHLALKKTVSDLASKFQDLPRPKAQEAFENDKKIFNSVRTLISNRGHRIVFYLFKPYDYTEDDMLLPQKVDAIDRLDVSNGMLWADEW